MFILFIEAVCIFIVRICKYNFLHPVNVANNLLTLCEASWDLIRLRKVFDDLAFLNLFLLAP